MSSEYGNGIGLDENFDLQIDTTGDIGSSSDIFELKKDLSVRVAGALMYGDGIERPASVASGAIGKPTDPGLRNDIGQAVSSILTDDERIDSVSTMSVSEANRGDEIIIETTAIIDTETEDFTFIVPSN